MAKRSRGRPVLYVDAPALLGHNCVDPRQLPDAILDLPRRIEPLLCAVQALVDGGSVIRNDVARTATTAEVARCVSPQYVAGLHRAMALSLETPLGWTYLDEDQTSIATPTSLEYALRSAGCVVAAALAAVESPEDVPMRAFALSRPPGHHNACTAELEHDYPLEDGTSANWVWACHGGCLLPNIPIAVSAVRARWGAGLRVAIVDIDAHFGDGTFAHFSHDASVFTVSLHEDQGPGMYPFFQGGASENTPTAINLALPPRSGDGAALRALHCALKQVSAFCPRLVLVACGFDALAADASSTLAYSAAGYGALVGAIVEALPDVPMVSFLYIPLHLTRILLTV
jgi:acetoin utilization deacetylase AcuC-like enzyme